MNNISLRISYRNEVDQKYNDIQNITDKRQLVNIKNIARDNFNKYEGTFNAFQRLLDRIVTYLGFSTERSRTTRKFQEIVQKTIPDAEENIEKTRKINSWKNRKLKQKQRRQQINQNLNKTTSK